MRICVTLLCWLSVSLFAGEGDEYKSEYVDLASIKTTDDGLEIEAYTHICARSLKPVVSQLKSGMQMVSIYEGEIPVCRAIPVRGIRRMYKVSYEDLSNAGLSSGKFVISNVIR